MNANRCHCGRFVAAGETLCAEHEAMLWNGVSMIAAGLFMTDILRHPAQFRAAAEAITRALP